MHFTTVVVSALMSTLAAAQTVRVQAVAVGLNPVTNETGLKYFPEKITAAPGTMVQFQFWTGNHTITQSTFDNPCVPLLATNAAAIDSSFQPTADSPGRAPLYTIMVNDTKPIWLYCAQGKHCQNGMALVINEDTSANATKSLENYKAIAAQAGGGAGAVPGAGTGTGGGAGTTPGGSSPTNVPGSAGSSVFVSTSSLLLAVGTAFLLL